MTTAATDSVFVPGKISASFGQVNTETCENAQNCFSSFFQASSDWICNVSSKVGQVGLKALQAISLWSKDTDTMGNGLDKLQTHIIVWIEHAADVPAHFSKLKKELKSVAAVIDFMMLVEEFKYFVRKEWQGDNGFSISAHVAGTFTRVCVGLSFINDLGFISLAKAADAIGRFRPLAVLGATLNAVKDWPLLREIPKLGEFAAKVGDLRVFAFIGKLAISRVILTALMATYAFAAMNAIRTLLLTTNSYLKTSAALDVINCMGELSLGALVAFGSANPVTLGVVGVASLVFGISKFVYNSFHVNELNAAKNELKIKV